MDCYKKYVIYYTMAWDLVNKMRTWDRSVFDSADSVICFEDFDSMDKAMCAIAYEILYQELSLAVQEKLDS